MDQTENLLDLLLKRTNLNIPFDDFLRRIEASYPNIGKIRDFEPIPEGYEDANVKLLTTRGAYALKIFTSERSEGNLHSYVEVLAEADKISVPAPELIKGRRGFLGLIRHRSVKTYYILTKFFEGEDFRNVAPTLSEMVEIAHYLAKLNTLNFSVAGLYDSWGNANLLQEYKKNKRKITPEQDSLIAPVVRKVASLDYSEFSQSVIHGDLQRKHVLKSKDGKYCILDFGCMRFDGKVFELSTHLAWFCLAPNTWGLKDEIVKEVVKKYTSIHQLTTYERGALPFLTEAAYVSYYLKTSTLTNEGDMSKETIEWRRSSKEMLLLFKDWNWQ